MTHNIRFSSLGLIIVLFGSILFLPGCDLIPGLGPKRDHSKFTSALLSEDRSYVAFSYSREIYRPATGMRAFPDGGVGKYLEDREFLGTYNLKSKETKVIKEFKNEHWTPGSGDLHLVDACQDMLFFRRGGQLRDVSANGFGFKYIDYLMELPNRTPLELDLRAETQAQDRLLKQVYLISANGDLLVFLSSGTEKKTAILSAMHRSADGKYRKILDVPAYISTYQGFIESRFYFWHPEDRPERRNGEPRGTFWVYDLATKTKNMLHWRDFRKIQQSGMLRRSCHKPVNSNASVSTDKQRLVFRNNHVPNSTAVLQVDLDKLR